MVNMQYKTNPITILITAIITAVIVGGGVCLWQNKDVTPEVQPEIEISEANYQNEELKFSLDIPEGYSVTGEKGFFFVTKKPTQEDETPLPEMNIRVENREAVSENDRCPTYRLAHDGKIYELSLYECLESEIFEDVVKSFQIIK